MIRQSVIDQSTGFGAPILRVYLLGLPAVEWADQPLAIPRRQARALLYCLAARLPSVPHALRVDWREPFTPDPSR